MNRRKVLVFVILFLILIDCFAYWDVKTVNSNGQGGSYTSLALDTSGYPHIAYYDSVNGDLKYAKWTGTSWFIQTIDSANDVGQYTSLAVDTSGYVHIAYYDVTNTDLKYAKKTDSGWIIQTVDSNGIVGRYASLKLNSTGYPYIAYRDDTNNTIKIARWTGSSWSISTFGSSFNGEHLSLALDAANNIYIAFRNISNNCLQLAAWYAPVPLTIDSSQHSGHYCSLKERNGKLHVAYSKNFSRCCYAYYDGSGWNIEEIVNSYAGSYTSLALDTSGYPHIAFYRTSGIFRLDYTKKTTSTWEISTVDKSADVGMHVSIEVDTSGCAHMAYLDATNNTLKYARWIPSSPSLECIGEPGYVSDGIEPDTGSRIDTFVFKIKYKNTVPVLPASGYPKLYIKKGEVHINGSPFVMTEIDPNDTNVLDGKIYSYSIQLSSVGNNYSYYIEVYDVEGASVSINFTGPNVINLSPQLSWTSEAGYESDGVEPDLGDIYSTFYFRIKVIDPEGDPIASGYPKVYVKKNGFDIGGSPFSMNFVGDNIYEKSLKLTSGINAYSYFFEVYDVYYNTKTVTIEKNGPNVNTPPQLLPTQENGYETDAVEPNVGSSSTTFHFRILYLDPDGHPPLSGYPKVYIKQGISTYTVITMNYVSGNYSSGAIFYTSTLLNPCSYYSYIFETIDSPFGVRYVYSNEFPGPLVKAKISGYVLDPSGNPMQNIKVLLKGYSTAYYFTTTDGYYEFINLTSGQQYTVCVDTTGLSWNFSPSSITFVLLSDMTQNFIRNNQKPIMFDCICEPYIAHSTTTIMFKVKYQDLDNDPPKKIKLHVKKGNTTILTLIPSIVSGEYATGAVFSTSTLLTPSSFYSYVFEVEDLWDASLIQISSNGPDIRVYIKGKVFNPDNTPMRNVEITLLSTDTKKVLTNSSGEYEFLYLKDGENYFITVSSFSYYSFTPSSRVYISLIENKEEQDFKRNNTPPVLVLEGGGVEPNESPPGTIFTYKVQYIDAENDPPLYYPLLKIKRNQGIILVTNMDFNAGTNYIYGVSYQSKCSLSIPATNYSYIIEVKDIWNAYTQIENTGPVVNTLPVLENATLSPQKGDLQTLFIFRVEYKDVDAHPPLSGYPKVVLQNSTITFSLSMNFVSGEYSTKAVYSTSTYLSVSGSYSFFIETYDQLYGYTKTELVPGPIMNNRPYIEVISYTTESNPQESFSVIVKYTDQEGDPPSDGYPKINFYISDKLIHSDTMKQEIPNEFFSYTIKFSTVAKYSFDCEVKDQYNNIVKTNKNYFVISTPPSKPEDLTFYQDKINYAVTTSKITLKWKSVDPDPNSRIVYELYFADNINNMKKIYEGENTEYTIYSLDDAKTYYWYVVAKDDTGRSSKSSLYSFNTINIQKDKVFNYPNPFKKGEKTNIVFYSDTDATAEIYICSLFGSVLFSDIVSVHKGSNVYEYDGSELDFSGSYIVLVKINNEIKKGKILLLNK